MANDWSVLPACGVDLNGDPGTGRDDEPHCVVWYFGDKKRAITFCAQAEYINDHNLDLAAAAIALDALKATGGDKDRALQASISSGINIQLRLNKAMALLEMACNGNLEMVHKIRKLVEV